MSVDLSQFHQVFFEESYEGLDVMESALLNIDLSELDSETINEIFRAAHSIKGGSGTFGFNEIAEFTHVVETLLDLIRSDQFVMESDHVDLFLKSVDCIRTMINAHESGESCDTSIAEELKQAFNKLLDSNNLPSADPESVSSEADNAEAAASGWKIYFKPDVDILRTGNDPVRMFRELAELGDISVEAVITDLPVLSNLDPEASFLAWNITLSGTVDIDQVNEVFEWVVDESDISISSLDSSSGSVSDIDGADSVNLTGGVDTVDEIAISVEDFSPFVPSIFIYA